jgi:hypothetical protein
MLEVCLQRMVLRMFELFTYKNRDYSGQKDITSGFLQKLYVAPESLTKENVQF